MEASSRESHGLRLMILAAIQVQLQCWRVAARSMSATAGAWQQGACLLQLARGSREHVCSSWGVAAESISATAGALDTSKWQEQ